MMRRPPGRPVPAAGFTLVEVLIALALLSLLMLVLVGAMRAMGQTEERVEQRIDQADRTRVATGFLRDVLGQASARPVTRPQAQPGALFEATPETLAWVGVMPARHGLGGRHFMRLGLEATQGGSPALVLRYLPWGNQPAFPDWSQAEAQVIVPDVRSRDALPGAVELQLQAAAGEWPPLVVRMAALAPTDPAGSRFTIGGRR